jgi:HlyD family secretion protein
MLMPETMERSKPKLDDLRIERRHETSSGWGWLLLGFMVVVLVGALAFWRFGRPHAVNVTTVVARESTALGSSQHTVLNASGYVTARRAATVSSKVTGKVLEVNIEEGQKIQAGQILARLDDTNVRASLRLA